MLPAKNRIKASIDFDLIYSKGVKRNSTYFLLFVLKNNAEVSRFGISTPSSRFSSAVDRNRAKRITSALIFEFLDDMEPSFDFIVIPNSDILVADHKDLLSDLKVLFGVYLKGK